MPPGPGGERSWAGEDVPSAPPRLLLDEHYPHWACEELTRRGIDAVSVQRDWPWLLGASDTDVLRAAVADSRVVLTEDLSTFPAAAVAVPDHLSVVYARSAVFPRTRRGSLALADSLATLLSDPPAGLGSAPLVWWLQVTA